jgi:hypothetical protein
MQRSGKFSSANNFLMIKKEGESREFIKMEFERSLVLKVM